MRGVVMHTAGDVRVQEREDPRIIDPTDAVIRLSATCICGSDLWPYRGVEPADHQVMGHEYCGVVEEIGSEVKTLKPGDFVVGSFVISDNTCEICQAGYQSKCVHARVRRTERSAPRPSSARIPYADGTLVRTPGAPRPRHAALAAGRLRRARHRLVRRRRRPRRPRQDASPSSVTAPSGLMAVLAAKQLGTERIIAMSRHPERQALAEFYGATDIVEERGEDGVAQHQGAHQRARRALSRRSRRHPGVDHAGRSDSTRPGGHLGFVGVNYDVADPRDRPVLRRHPRPRRPRPGPPVPSRPDRAHLGPARSTQARSSTSPSRSTRPPTATRPWTNAEPPRSF